MVNSEISFHLSKETRFILLFTFILLLAFSPFKSVGQFIALIFLVGLILFVQIRPQYHILKYGVVFFIYIFMGIIYRLLMKEFSFINYFVFFITSSSILILLYDLRPVLNYRSLRKLSYVTLIILFFEAIYGMVQALAAAARRGTFDFASGDNVRGTIEPSLVSMRLGGNVIYAILISSLLVFALIASGYRFTLPRLFVYFFILMVWVFASVLHTVFFLGLAVLVGIFIIKKPPRNIVVLKKVMKYRRIFVLLFFIILVLVAVILPGNLRTAPNYIKSIIDISQFAPSEKARSIYLTLVRLPVVEPLQPIIGLGAGQYSSRASLIMTGQYLKGTSLPLPTYMSSMTEEIIWTLWSRVLLRPGHGSTYFPYFSWLSLYGEFGIIGFLLVIVVTISLSLKLRKWHSTTIPGLNLGALILLYYLVFLGFQDNYWEYTQAIFPAFLGLAITYNYLKLENTKIIPTTENI